MKIAFSVCAMMMVACGSSSTPGADGGSDGFGGDATTMGDGANMNDASGKGCPTVTLSTTLPVNYAGDTTGKPNLVTSQRLEWGDAPDDALLFVAPSAGTYRIGMPNAPSTNGGCGASVREYGANGTGPIYTEQSCPAPGATKAIDGIFTALPPSTTSDLTLAQGEHVLVWVSCTTWSNAKTGPYTLTIQKM